MKTVITKAIIELINFYQNYISKYTKSSCRYYPTCSEYAKWQFEANHPLKALLFSLKRVLSCNPFFEGGFDYPIVKKSLKRKYICSHNQHQNLFLVKFFLIQKDKDRFYLIKNQTTKDEH